MRAALVHDWLNGVRGGEKVLEQLCLLYPNATVASRRNDLGDFDLNGITDYPSSERRYIMNLPLDRITFSPSIMGGRACIRGMRITVSLILGLVANGMTTEEIMKEYPDLESEDVHQALQYAALLANEEVHPLSVTRP